MPTFKLLEDQRKEHLYQVLLEQVPFQLTFIVIYVFMMYDPSARSFDEMLPMMFFLLFMVGLAGWMRNRQHLIYWESYQLTIGEDYLETQQDGLDHIRIEKEDVTTIEQRPQWLYIGTSRPYESIFIPYGVENYEEVVEELSRFGKIIPYDSLPFLKRYPLVQSAAIYAVVCIFVFFSSPPVTLLSGCLLVAYYLRVILLRMRSRYSTPRSKVTVLVLLVPLFYVAFEVWNAIQILLHQ